MVIGAGLGGLAAAIGLARAGMQVTVFERAETVGGKVYESVVADRRIDSGPTALTLRWVFDELFAAAGTSLEAEVGLHRSALLARHCWGGDQVLDIQADPKATRDAIGAFAGAKEAAGFAAYSREAGRIYGMLEKPFLRAPRPGMPDLMQAVGMIRSRRLRPFTTAWAALGTHFKDARLRELYGHEIGRAGTSPYVAPAAAMIVPHIEQQQGVWLVEGGMQRLVDAMARVAVRLGAVVRTGTHVKEVMVARGRASGVRLHDGEVVVSDAVVMNGEPSALGLGRLGRAVEGATPALKFPQRSLSALTFATVGKLTEAGPGELPRQTVFHSKDYRLEYELIQSGRLPTEPTVTLVLPDRGEGGPAAPTQPLLLAINAPPNGERRAFSQVEVEQCVQGITALLLRSGVAVEASHPPVMATPAVFQRMFPASGGALYGPALLGRRASFVRPTNRTKMPGLYLAGGGTHPGAGVALAALSGQAAAAAALEDLLPKRPLLGRLLGRS